MLIINSFLFCGLVCLIAQIIMENTKLTPGHITSIFVSVGVLLDSYGIYDLIIEKVGGGALLPITSFGRALVHGAVLRSSSSGVIGLFMGMFDLTATGISFAIVCSFLCSIIFRPTK